jgi:hypothetical protein
MLPSSHYINKQEALFKFPMLNPDGLKGASATSGSLVPCKAMPCKADWSSQHPCVISPLSSPAVVCCRRGRVL